MKVIVVGGHTRNIGKTSVAAGLIRELSHLNWTAVKITQYGHGVCSRDGKSCQCAPGTHSFVVSEETDQHGHADTCRLLAAGASRSFWVRVRDGRLGEAVPDLCRRLSSSEYVLIESNSILAFLKPVAYLLVVDRAKRDFKESTRKFLRLADALVPVDLTVASAPQSAAGAAQAPDFDPAAVRWQWPGFTPGAFAGIPVFPVTSGDYFNPNLCRFVRSRLGV